MSAAQWRIFRALRPAALRDALVAAVLRRVGSRAFALEVRAYNAPAIALYVRHGFVDVGPKTPAAEVDSPDRTMIALLG